MSLTFIGELGDAEAASSVVSITTSDDVPAGGIVFLFTLAQGTSAGFTSHPSVSDPVGNEYTEIQFFNDITSGTSRPDGYFHGHILATRTTAALPAGSTITVTTTSTTWGAMKAAAFTGVSALISDTTYDFYANHGAGCISGTEGAEPVNARATLMIGWMCAPDQSGPVTWTWGTDYGWSSMGSCWVAGSGAGSFGAFASLFYYADPAPFIGYDAIADGCFVGASNPYSVHIMEAQALALFVNPIHLHTEVYAPRHDRPAGVADAGLSGKVYAHGVIPMVRGA